MKNEIRKASLKTVFAVALLFPLLGGGGPVFATGRGVDACVVCETGESESLVGEGLPALPVFTNAFWDWYPFFPGNGNLQIYPGATAAEEELSFSFADGSVFPPPPTNQSGSGPDPDEPVAKVVENKIFDPDGVLLCSADFGEQPGVFQLKEEPGGEVLYTLYGNLVLEGDIEIPRTGREFKELIREWLLFSFKHRRVYMGLWPRGEPLATATENIELANPMRHLVIAALVGGRCGSPGLD